MALESCGSGKIWTLTDSCSVVVELLGTAMNKTSEEVGREIQEAVGKNVNPLAGSCFSGVGNCGQPG